MLNRRTFFKSIGAAILGTAIALKIPDNLIPSIPEIKYPEGVITWSMMERAFEKIKNQYKEPSIVIVNKGTYEYFKSKGYC